MDNRPKRRKDKYNPYTLSIENQKYYISFNDSNNRFQKVELTREMFDCFDEFELEDKSIMNEYDRHTEQSEQSDSALNKKTSVNNIHFEDMMMSKMRNGQLKKMLFCLTPLQRERVILFYWERFSCPEIAEMQGCTKQAVSLSIRQAREKLKEKILNDEDFT